MFPGEGILRPFFALFSLHLCLSAQSRDPEELSRRAREFMAAGRYAEAVPLYRELLGLLPGDAGVSFLLGLAELQTGAPEAAERRFEEVVQVQPGHANAWLFLGLARVKLGKLDLALPSLEQAVRLDPKNPLGRLELADALLTRNRHAAALGHFRALTELDPKDARGWYGLGRCHLALSRERFDLLERTASGSAWYYALVGRSRLEQQQFGSAHYYLRQALAAKPGFRGVHAALAEVYRRSGHNDWAAIEEEREKAAKPADCAAAPLECAYWDGRHTALVENAGSRTDPESLYWLCLAHSALSRQAFERLSELPPSAVSHRLAAEILALQERHAEASAEWRKAYEMEPGNPALALETARSLMAAEDHRSALPILEKLAAGSRPLADLFLLLGQCLLSLQEPARAVPHLERAAAGSPGDRRARAALGRALLQSGEPGRAIPHLEAALPDDTDGNLHYLLAQAHLRAGDRETAARLIARRQELQQAARKLAEERDRNFRVTPPSSAAPTPAPEP